MIRVSTRSVEVMVETEEFAQIETITAELVTNPRPILRVVKRAENDNSSAKVVTTNKIILERS